MDPNARWFFPGTAQRTCAARMAGRLCVLLSEAKHARRTNDTFGVDASIYKESEFVPPKTGTSTSLVRMPTAEHVDKEGSPLCNRP